jgi:cytosine/adenosine deaminase-related metal-dependent hydrolase
LRVLSQSHHSLIIHGNYLTDDELDLMAGNASRMSVVYCPRTHAYFGHPPYPLARRLANGVHVAVGTDSRASNPDLNMLREMSYIARHHQDVDPATVLALGTLDGARALGRGHDCGSLLPGKRADMIAVALPSHETTDPYEMLFDGDPHVHRIVCESPISADEEL